MNTVATRLALSLFSQRQRRVNGKPIYVIADTGVSGERAGQLTWEI